MKKCPFCAEEIQEEAIKCRFCNEFIDGRQVAENKKKPKWYFRSPSLFISFLLIGPFVLPLVWLHPQYSKVKKFLISLIILIVTLGLLKLLQFSTANIQEYYNMIQGM